ncbi:hypothetical protein ACOME3_004590 [Neoechinorhynchus agilis]
MCDTVDNGISEENFIHAELAITMKYLDMLDSDHDGKFVNPILISAEHHNAITELRQSRNFANSSSDLTELDCLIMGSQKRFIDRRSQAFRLNRSTAVPSSAPNWKRKIKKSVSDYGGSRVSTAPKTTHLESNDSSSKSSSVQTNQLEVKKGHSVDGVARTNWRAVKIKNDAAKIRRTSKTISENVYHQYKLHESPPRCTTYNFECKERDDVEMKGRSLRQILMSRLGKFKRKFPF